MNAQKFAAKLGSVAQCNSKVTGITRCPGDKETAGVDIAVSKNGAAPVTEHYDEVVVAILKDTALQLLGESASLGEKIAFSMLQYEEMKVFVHNDPNVLSEKLKDDQGYWRYQYFNYRYEGDDFGDYVRGATTYVPRLDLDHPTKEVLLPLLTYSNPDPTPGVTLPDPALVTNTHVFRHVKQTIQMFEAGMQVHRFNGSDRIWYCGNDVVINFHEGALCSGLTIAKALGVPYPFTSNNLKQEWVYNLFDNYMLQGLPPMELLYLNPH